MKVKSLKDGYSSTIVLVLLLTIFFTGINGLAAFILFAVFSNSSLGRDPEIKHGLSSGTSRLGGVAIIISIIIGCCWYVFIQNNFDFKVLISEINSIIIFSLIIGLIGLAEDFSQNLSSQKRLTYMVIIVSAGLYAQPELIPIDIDIFKFFGVDSANISIYIFTVFMICGFINAGNIADGANGLLASIFLIFFIFAYSIDGSIFNFSVVITLLAFIIFNVFTGKIFLGDFGSYSLSSLVAFKSLEIYSKIDISVFFLSAILVYPCFEIARSLIVRALKSRSIMTPDNFHFHNHVNTFFLSLGFSRNASNSITGLAIASMTSIFPIILYFVSIPLDSIFWAIFFLFQLIALSLIYIFFEKKFSS